MQVILEAIEYQLVETSTPIGAEGRQFRPRKAYGGGTSGVSASEETDGRAGQAKSVSVAMRIERGPDWKWGDQDGGPNAKGMVTAVGPAEGGPSDGWVRIRWDNGHVNVYRWGADGGKYDLQACLGP